MKFVRIVKDTPVFPHFIIPFLLDVIVAFLLLKEDQPGNSLISFKSVDTIFK